MTDYRGEVVHREDRPRPLVINALVSLTTPLVDITNGNNFGSLLESKVGISAILTWTMGTKQGKLVDALTLTKQWQIPLDRAKKTILKTTCKEEYGKYLTQL